MGKKVAVFWFRRDLRLHDNRGLLEALSGAFPVLPIFIFDPHILHKLPPADARVTFIHQSLQKIRESLRKDHQSSLALYWGSPREVFTKITAGYAVQCVHTNHDYEPYARERDASIAEFLSGEGIPFKTYKDQVIYEKDEVIKGDGTPYVVYTPYKNKWKERFHAEGLNTYETGPKMGNLAKDRDLPFIPLEDMGFVSAQVQVPNYEIAPDLIRNYEATRNFPAKERGTSHLGPHLRFGTVSIRQIMQKAIAVENEVFWNELIWREFFMQILWHFPQTVKTSFRPKYDWIPWRNSEAEFERWKTGQTGYPLVDAGMRELNQTGYMHNRVRMLAASFLCKHLLIDWRWGETYFAEKLLDYDLSANVGNWQWAAGSGVDAAPYFRIFNPMAQMEKFDKQRAYIHKWVPDLQELTYPPPMIDHKMARERCLKTYGEAMG